ncbi:MAG TPA: hypothetical protein PLE30_03230 [Candidatus Kapabacteria bacterium]|nr:hypothetical protein [Candidatus Kapabacteria bacterium]
MSDELLHRLEEMLPDYLFGSLNQEDRLFFESNIEKFPDLKSELEQADEVFKKFDKMNFERQLDYSARNISVKVIKKREAKAMYRYSSMQYLLRYLVPFALIIGGTYFFMFNQGGKNETIASSTTNKNNDSIFSSESVIYQLLEYPQEISSNSNLSNELELIYDEEILLAFSGQDKNDNLDNIEVYDSNLYSANKVINNLQSLDEDEFQNFIQDLQHANIKE